MGNYKPIVSIIVPVYNVEQYIGKCIDSILSQTYRDFEVLLIDDGSTDSSGRICDSYALLDERVSVVHKQNRGLSSARNSGLAIAKGEWIMHVDGDDWIDSTMIEDLLTLANLEASDLVLSGFRMVWGMQSKDFHCLLDVSNKAAMLNSFIGQVWTILCGCLVKKNLYSQYSLCSPEGITYCEDFYLSVRLLHFASGVSISNLVYYNYRQRETSIVHNLDSKNSQEELFVYLDTIHLFKALNVYSSYEKSFNWRLLKATQDYLLNDGLLPKFLEINQNASFSDIVSCPFINNKIKVMSVLAKMKLPKVIKGINYMRKMLNRS